MKSKRELQKKRTIRTRAHIAGSNRPRLSVFRSNKYLYAQVIEGSKVLVTASSKAISGTTKVEAAEKLGEAFAQEAAKKKVREVVFDKGAYKYHGRVKAFADGARKGGLIF